MLCFPDHHDHVENTLDQFFNSNPENYTCTFSSPLGSSNHCAVLVSSPFTLLPPIPQLSVIYGTLKIPGMLM